jgi:hypothetical protein
MKGIGYVSLFLKNLPTLIREWVTSGYLARNLASCMAKLATWVRNSAPNCQSLVFLLGFRLEVLADNFAYSPSFGNQIAPYKEETNIFPSLRLLYHVSCQSIKRRTKKFQDV